MTDEELKALERSSFNSFDPDGFDDFDGFDPEGFDTYSPKGRGKAPVSRVMRGKIGKLQAQFDLIVSSTCANNTTKIELFNAFRSQSGAYNPQVNLLKPIDNLDIVAAVNAARAGVGAPDAVTLLTENKIYFNSDGSLVYNDKTNGNGVVTISCRQVPYLALLKSSMVQPFLCEKLRMTVVSDGQIDNDIVHISNSFLGSQKRNTISPRSFFRPDQFQGLIIDIPARFKIDGEKGLEYIVNNKGALAAQTITFNMFLSRYVKNQIS